MNRKMDAYNESFKEFDAFMECIGDREKQTKRLTVPGKSIKFLPILPEDVAQVAKELGVAEALVEDTIRKTDDDFGTCLVLKRGKNKFLVGSSTFLSAGQRMQLFGKGLWNKTYFPKTLAKDFTEQFSLIEKPVKVVVIDDKVRAIMSDQYAFVPMKEVFARVVEGISKKFDSDFKVEEAYVDHYMATLKIVFPKGDEKLTELYQLPPSDGWRPGLVITTSDTGYHAIKIDPYFRNNDNCCIIMLQKEKYNKKHIGNLTVDRITENLDNFFLRYQDAIEKMVKLLTIEIKNPITVITKGAKECDFTKKATEGMVEEIKYLTAMTKDPITAYDCYKILANYAKYVEGTPETKLLAQEMAGKAINLNYERLDKAVDQN